MVKAAQWNIPVVGVQWLADLVMGNAQVIHSVNHQRYKPQANPDPFRIDLNVLPPCLMRKTLLTYNNIVASRQQYLVRINFLFRVASSVVYSRFFQPGCLEIGGR